MEAREIIRQQDQLLQTALARKDTLDTERERRWSDDAELERERDLYMEHKDKYSAYPRTPQKISRTPANNITQTPAVPDGLNLDDSLPFSDGNSDYADSDY